MFRIKNPKKIVVETLIVQRQKKTNKEGNEYELIRMRVRLPDKREVWMSGWADTSIMSKTDTWVEGMKIELWTHTDEYGLKFHTPNDSKILSPRI